MQSDRALMELQVAALFTHDATGQLLAINAPHGGPAPRFFWGRTLEGDVLRFGRELPADLMQRLAGIVAAEPRPAALGGPPSCMAELRAALAEHAPVEQTFCGPAYRFPDTIEPVPGLTRISAEAAALLRRGFPNLRQWLADSQPCLGIVRGSDAVSVCFTSRRTARVAEAGVETTPEFRGRGFAAAVTVGWALAIRAEGLEPFYSTSWENTASQGVARRLGLVQYGVDLDLT